jgi:formylglycine-generating enzyme
MGTTAVSSLSRRLRRATASKSTSKGTRAVGRARAPDLAGMVRIEGGTFRMGSDLHYPEEAPAHLVRVDPFWIDARPVTNAEFARFVAATGHVTLAERPLEPRHYPGADPADLRPGALVFAKTAGPVDLRDYRQWWRYVPGACWSRPEGPGSDILQRMDHPVVHVAFEDAQACAHWAGKELPSEAEWELAARGGLEGAEYCWGEQLMPGGRPMANTWQGRFPYENTLEDGFERTSPVGSYPPNGYGLYDMAGNVWEWTADWYVPRHEADAAKPCCVPSNPRGGSRRDSFDPTMPEIRIPRRVAKGGSFLCSPDYCLRYRPAARHAQMIDTAIAHLGFRCVVRESR